MVNFVEQKQNVVVAYFCGGTSDASLYMIATINKESIDVEMVNPFRVGGGVDSVPPTYPFSLITQKVIKIICSFFLTFNKIQLEIFFQQTRS